MVRLSRKIVIVGASSAIAEHVARIWARQGNCDFVLVGRSETALASIAADLPVRGPQVRCEIMATNFTTAAEIAQLLARFGLGLEPNVVLIAHGTLPIQDDCQSDIAYLEEVLRVNGTSACLLAEGFAQIMKSQGAGNIAVIGSVAGDRGRKSNYAYGAAKGLVETYLQGLTHRFARENIKVTLVKPGPTQTPMTAHLQAAGAKLATVEKVAGDIAAGIEAGKPVVYAPIKWAFIMAVIRNLPRFIFNRMDI